MALQSQGNIVSISSATASSQSGGGFGPDKAYDSNNVSFWDSGTSHDINTYLRVDLGSAKRVGGARWYIQFGGGFTPTAWKIQYSDDDSAWTTVATGDDSLKNIFTDYGNDSYYIAWAHQTHRYWRIQPNTGYSIANGEWVITEMVYVEGVNLAAPVLSSPTIPAGGTTLTATIDQTGVTPASGSGNGGFTLSGTTRTVTAWSISGTVLTLTLSGAVGQGKTVTYSYDGTAALTNGDNAMATFSGVSVTNNSTVGAPTCSSPAIPASGQTITVTLSQSGVTPSSGATAGGFTVSGLDVARTVTGWSISGTTLTLTLSGRVGVGDAGITLNYDSGTGTLTNGETVMASFTGTAVTNNSTEVLASVPTRNFFGLM